MGAVVRKTDNGGGTTCLAYDLLGRVTSKTYSGLNSGNTPNVNFIYDSTTNASINCPTGSNQLGRLAEVSTGGGAPNGYTDEGFCYDVVGNPTDTFSWINGTIWVHAAESYFPTGIPKTLAVGNQPTITYGLDPMARITSASASGSGQNPLTSVIYNTAGLPTTVNFGSGDSSAYGWLNGIGPMSSATFNVGSGSSSHTLTWNANGTLQKLAITDTLNSADAQTCNYTYDDLNRLLTDNCSSVWNQSFNYDPFGNVTKSGSSSWQPGYNQTNNHYQLSGTAYDANGRLTQDTFDTGITWDIDGNIVTQSGTWFAYDGLGRNMGSVLGSTYVNNVYAPDGSFFATADNNGNIKKMFVPLPMSTAVYSGGSLQQYRRTDWQGSVRVASTPSKTLFSDTAYGAFGEPYSHNGTANYQYAGLTSDISSGTEQVSLSRRYHPTQGRWISPDSSIPDVLDPQMFDAYHYALNRPTSITDPTGLVDCPQGKTCPIYLPGYGGSTTVTATVDDVLIFGPTIGRECFGCSLFTGVAPATQCVYVLVNPCGSAPANNATKQPPKPQSQCPPSTSSPPTDTLGKLVNVFNTVTHPLDLAAVNASMFLVSGVSFLGAGVAVAGGCLDPTPFEPVTCVAGSASGVVLAATGTGAAKVGVDFFKNYTIPAFKNWGCPD